MSITVISAFSRMGFQTPPAPSPSANIFKTQVSLDKAPDIPQLPGEIMYKIFEHVLNGSSKSALLPVLETNSLCYSLAAPIMCRTIYLNRATLQGLTEGTSWRENSHLAKDRALTKCTNLVIDNIFMLFDRRYDARLRSFCNYVRLPNVTKVIFRHGRHRGPKLHLDEGEFEFFLEKSHRVSHAGKFTPVLPNKFKEVCVHISPNEKIQRVTTDRVMQYAGWLSGTNTFRIHQPAKTSNLILNVDWRHPHIPRPGTTVYSFYRDLSGASAKPHLLEVFETIINRQVGPLVNYRLENWSNIFPRFVDIVNGNMHPDDMLVLAKKMVRDPAHQTYPDSEFGPDQETRICLKIFDNVFVEMLAILNPDFESACPCCGEKGWPLNP
jgi:hypothetical protein